MPVDPRLDRHYVEHVACAKDSATSTRRFQFPAFRNRLASLLSRANMFCSLVAGVIVPRTGQVHDVRIRSMTRVSANSAGSSMAGPMMIARRTSGRPAKADAAMPITDSEFLAVVSNTSVAAFLYSS